MAPGVDLGDISNRWPCLIYWPQWPTFRGKEEQFSKALFPPAHPDKSCLVSALAPSCGWVYASAPRETSWRKSDPLQRKASSGGCILIIYLNIHICVLVPMPELVRQKEDLKPGFKPLFKLGCSSVCLWSPFPWPQPLQACWQYHVSVLLNVSDLKLPVQRPSLVMRLIEAVWAALACNTIKFQEIENIPVRLVGL